MGAAKNAGHGFVCDQAYKEATRVLHGCIHPVGIKASAGVRGYPQVWARDSMITLLGASLIGDERINHSLKASIDVLARNQTPLGCIPNNVDVRSLKPNFQAYADSGLWFVIGSAFFLKQTGDKDFIRGKYPAIKKTLKWYEYQDADQTGLITMAEASDWEDLFAVRGKGLYVNVLHYIALRGAGLIASCLGDSDYADDCTKKAKRRRSRINSCFWYKEGDIDAPMRLGYGVGSLNEGGLCRLAKERLSSSNSVLKEHSYYLPYITFRDFGEWFDSLGNLLAILSGVADEERAGALLNVIERFRIAEPHPMRSIYPPVFPGGSDWRYYYRYGNLNLPHQYHNGGIWPFIGGFYVAVLVKMKRYMEARKALESLTLLNKQGKENLWEFNEWFNGKTIKPMGMAEQAWSAGMYIYAYEAVRKKRVLFL
jgi:glycogen debranching enzyme